MFRLHLRIVVAALAAVGGLLVAPATSAHASTSLHTDTLSSGHTITAGQHLRSNDDRFHLVMQADSNLVIYDRHAGRATWSTGTTGSGATRAVMQTDGNLVLYRPDGRAVWASQTDRFGGARMVMQTDGNLVLYRNGTAIWAKGSYLGAAMTAGQQMGHHELRRSPNGRYMLLQQTDGNLVQMDLATNRALWATGTDGSGATRTVMQADGNLVVYRDHTPVWATNTQAADPRLVVQDDGNVVIYAGHTVVWEKVRGGTAPGAPGTPSGGLNAKVDTFVARYNGVAVDVDGAYGAQCTDLFNAYHRDVMSGSYVRMGGNGGAANLWNTTNPQMYDRYTKVPASQPARKGDIAVWATSKPYSGGYGHVSIVIADKGSTLSTFTQNPGAAGVRDDSKAHLLGYFRPKA